MITLGDVAFLKKSIDCRSLGSKALDMRQSCAPSKEVLAGRWHDATKCVAEAMRNLEQAHAEVCEADENLVLAEAKAIHASRHLQECRRVEAEARAAYRPHAPWMSAARKKSEVCAQQAPEAKADGQEVETEKPA